MFFDVYKQLCEAHGQKPGTVAKILGIPTSLVTKWKQTGATPRADTLTKIADYFNVSIDYLTGNGDAPTDQFIAFYGKVKGDLTQDDIDDLMISAAAKAERNRKRKSGE